MKMWVIYKSPSDYPGSWVVREHDVPGGPRQDCDVCTSLNEARKLVPFGLIRIDRFPSDPPQLVETWM